MGKGKDGCMVCMGFCVVAYLVCIIVFAVFADQETKLSFEILKDDECSHINQVAAFLFSLFLGEFGADRFYLGYTFTGLAKLFTFGGFGIWWLVDLILIIVNDIPSIRMDEQVGESPGCYPRAW